MINGIIFDERLNTARDWGNIFKKAFPTDGVISGFDITGTGAMFTVAPGYIVMCGRVINNDGIMTVDNTASLQNGYVRLKYRIDLNAAPSREDFSQGSFVIDTSGSPVFPSLLQENINGTGKVYEAELAVFQMTGGAISSRVRMMPPAGLDVLYVFGEGGGYFSVRREGGLTRLAVRGNGGAEIAALNIDDAGALSTFGALTVGAGLSVGGDIAQNAGKAQLNEAITLNGKNGYALTMRWVDTVGVVFDMFDGAVLHESVMSLNADGTVTIPVDVPGIQGKLDLNDDLVFTSKAKGVYTTGGGSKKALIVPDSGGKLWVGSTDDNFVSGEAAVAANGKVSLINYEPGKGYTAAIEAGGRDINVARNLLVGEDYEVKVGGDLTVAGAFKMGGGLVTDKMTLSDTLTTNKLIVTGDTNMYAASVEGDLTLNRKLVISGQSGMVCGNAKLVTYENNDMRLGSTSSSESPQRINILASSQINFGIGTTDMLRIDANAIDAFSRTIKTGGAIEAESLKVNSFTPKNLTAIEWLNAPTIKATTLLQSTGELRVSGTSSFSGNISAGSVAVTVQDLIANRNIQAKGMLRLYPKDTAKGYGATIEMDSVGTALTIYANPSEGNDAGRLAAIRVTKATGQTAIPYGLNVGNGLSVNGGLTVNGVLNANNGLNVRYGDLVMDGVSSTCKIGGGMIRQGSTSQNLSIYGDTAGAKPGVAIAYGTGVVALPGVAAASASTAAANLYISSSGTLYRTGSTRRIKDNIKDADANEIMKTVRRLKVRNFTSRCEGDDQSKIRTGGIAEEFFIVDKRLAVYDMDSQGNPQLDEQGEPIVNNIDTGELLYRLLSAVQTLDKRLSELEA